MNILITGIHGFVGSNLVKTLCVKHTIFGLDIVSPKTPGIEKTYCWKDLEENKLPAIDVIIHLAGKAHETKKQSEAKSYFEINTGLTIKAFDYFLTNPVKKFIFFSSVKAAAETVNKTILTEDVVPNPKGPYGKSKFAAEKYIRSHFDMDATAEKSVYILRPCMIHGPGNKGNLNLLYKIVKKGIPWPLGAFKNRRSFTSIGNLCYVIDGLVNKDISSGIYNISDDEALSTNELIDVMHEVTGNKGIILHLPKKLMLGCAVLGGVLHLPLNTDRLRKLTENYVVSNSKIKKALGTDKMPVKAHDGLIKTFIHFNK